MIKLRYLLEASARDRMKKRVHGKVSEGEFLKEEKKIRSIMRSFLQGEESSRNPQALEEIERAGSEVYKRLPDNGSVDVEEFYNLFFNQDPRGMNYEIRTAFKGAFVYFGRIIDDVFYEHSFIPLLVQDCNKVALREQYSKGRGMEYSFYVEVYIRVLALYCRIFATKLFGETLSK